MYKIQGVIPISLKDSNGIEFTTECIQRLEKYEVKIFDVLKKKQGKGFRKICTQIGQCRFALRHRVLIFEGIVEFQPEGKPYLRLFYSYKDNQIDPDSIGLIFSNEPGVLTESNYKIIEVK